jgi:uncharacterized membrane protein YbhN (UPF0104 family)
MNGTVRRTLATALQEWSAHPRVTVVIRVVLSLGAVGAVVWLVLVPQFVAARDDFGRLAHLPLWLVAGAALLESASLLSNTLMTVSILNEPTIPYHRMLAVDLADLAANHTLPGGGAAAGAIRYRLLRAEKVSSVRAIGATTIEVGLSNVALGLVFAGGAVFVVGQLHSAAFTTTAVAVGALLAAVAFVVWMLVRHPKASRAVAARVRSGSCSSRSAR